MEPLKAPKGSRKRKKIIGRGASSNHGRSSGKGHDGQNSRSGGGVRLGFEGGQMPLYRRLARRGFSNARYRKEYEIVNLSTLNKRYESGETVNHESLQKKGIVKNTRGLVKILGNGDLDKKLTISVNKVSASAKAKIEAAGGTIEGTEEGNDG
jgi:large subunit ribosomal protein L15